MRRVPGTAHTSPGLQVCAGRKMCRPAKNRAMTAPAMNNGRYGSSRVRFPIHAPLNPKATRTRGPRQHVDARIAASPPTKSAPDPVRSREYRAISGLMRDSRLELGGFPQDRTMRILFAQLLVATLQS